MSTVSGSVDVRAPHEQAEGTRSQILRWLKAVGDPVQENEPLIEIETDKVTVEVPSPATGVLREILRQEQAEIAPGEILGRIDLGRIEAHSAGAQRAVAPSASGSSPGCADAAQSQHHTNARPETRARDADAISPAVKRLLQERNLNPEQITGSGQGGRITVDDVLRAGGEPVLVHFSAAPVADTVTVPSHRVAHSAIRKRIAEHMVSSLLHTAPHVTTIFEADFSALLAHRARYRAEFETRGVSLTFTAYVLAACVSAIGAVPEVNARWHPDALEIFDTIDIGVGTAVPDKGLIVPVVRAVQTLSLFEIARQLGELVRRARENRLTARDVRGGTFTISNHGVSGSLLAAPIVINQPQVAILGVGKLEKRAVVVERGGSDQVVVRPRCYVTLTIDHRVLDGHRANRFLEVLVDRLENWPQDKA